MARSEDDGVVRLLIIGFVRISSGALVHVAATAVDDFVGLAYAHALVHYSDPECCSSFWNCPFGNLGAFFRPKIGDMAAFFFNFIPVFIRQAAALLEGASGVRSTSCWNWDDSYDMKGSLYASEISKSLQICSTSSELASVQQKDCDIVGCGGAGSGNVPEHSISRIFRCHLRIACVKRKSIY